MTIKELNKIRGDIFSAGLENAEIKKALDVAGIAYLYELTELPDKHASIVLTARAQMNDNTLRERGFTPENTKAKLLLTYHQQSKTVTF